jgi:hypothetical protein
VTGAPLLGKVFASATILTNTAIDQVSYLLNRPKQQVQAAKTRQILGPDSGVVTVGWPADVGDLDSGETRLPVTLRSTSAHIPLVVSGLTVTSTTPTVRASIGQAPVPLAPGQSAQVVVTLTWASGPRDWKPLATATVDGGLKLSGTVSTPWAEALATDAVIVTSTLTGEQAVVHGSVYNGQIWVWGAVAVLVVLLALFVLGRTAVSRRSQPALQGVLTAQGAPRSMPLRGRSATISHATLGIAGRGTVRGRRDRLLSSRTLLEIAYSRDGHPDQEETKAIGPNETASISGVEFEWRPR